MHQSQTGIKPSPSSFDSGQEFSLDHWLEVSWLVNKADEDPDNSLIAENPDHCLLVSL
jgi:hypothetical protein